MTIELKVTVDFDPSRPAHLRSARYYTHEARPDRIPVGASWPSVTTVCGLLGAVWMAPWAAKMMYEAIEKKAKENAAGVWTTAEALEIARESKAAWRTKRDTAAQKGTDLHEVFEDLVQGGSNWNGLKDENDWSGYCWAAKVSDWLKSSGIAATRVEQVIAHPYGGGTAGRYDAVVELPGRKRSILLDLKTGKNVPTSCPMQLAAYAEGLKLDGLSVGGAIVLHAPAIEHKPGEMNTAIIARAEKMKIASTFYTMGELRDHWRAFQGLRRVWSWHEKHGGEG